MFLEYFSFTQQFFFICKSSYTHVRDLASIRCHLVVMSFVNALVSRKLDYCNFLLASLTQKQINHLQKNQNVLCQFNCHSYYSHNQHHHQIEAPAVVACALQYFFKLWSHIYKAIHSFHPSYLACYFNSYRYKCNTRSSFPNNFLAILYTWVLDQSSVLIFTLIIFFNVLVPDFGNPCFNV